MTLFSDRASVSGLSGSVRLFAVISWSPGGNGRSGTTTQSPRLSALVRPTASPLSETTTSEPGSARPATTESPEGLTRTTSMLGVFLLFFPGASGVPLSTAFGGAGEAVGAALSVCAAGGGTGTTALSP